VVAETFKGGITVYCGEKSFRMVLYCGKIKTVLGWCNIVVASASNKLLVQETQIRHNQYLWTNERMGPMFLF
jgi:hypothetical protein